MPNPTPKRTLPNPKTHRIKPRLIITILLNQIFFGLIKNFFIKILFCQKFRLAEFQLVDKKEIEFCVKNSIFRNFLSKFIFLFIFTGGYLRKDRLSGRQTICLIFNVLRALKFRVRNPIFFIRTYLIMKPSFTSAKSINWLVYP